MRLVRPLRALRGHGHARLRPRRGPPDPARAGAAGPARPGLRDRGRDGRVPASPARAAGVRPRLLGALPARDGRLGARRAAVRGAAGARRALRPATTARSCRSRARRSGSGSRGRTRSTTEPDGSLLFRGLLPHVTLGRRAAASRRAATTGGSTPEPAVLDRGRLVHSYRLEPMGDPPRRAEPPARRRPPTAYADEVMDGVRREWDDAEPGLRLAHEPALRGAAGARLRPPRRARGRAASDALDGRRRRARGALRAELPARAAGRPARAAPGSARRRAARRRGAGASGRPARPLCPEPARFAVPTDLLRPERLAYHAHRDAERRIARNRSDLMTSTLGCLNRPSQFLEPHSDSGARSAMASAT